MITFGITGSIASGKTSVARYMAGKKHPLFNADTVVSNLYKEKKFISILVKKFNLKLNKKIKPQIKLVLMKNKNNLYHSHLLIIYQLNKKRKKLLKTNLNIQKNIKNIKVSMKLRNFKKNSNMKIK